MLLQNKFVVGKGLQQQYYNYNGCCDFPFETICVICKSVNNNNNNNNNNNDDDDDVK